MKKLLVALSVLLSLTGGASAYGRHHQYHRSYERHYVENNRSYHHSPIVHRRSKRVKLAHGVGKGKKRLVGKLEFPTQDFHLVTVETKAGKITVAADAADKFVGFINDLPFMPHAIGCYASSGHVTHSFHYTGHACDIDQTGRNATSKDMYHIHDLAEKWGLRDGCTFGDCGHVDTGTRSRN